MLPLPTNASTLLVVLVVVVVDFGGVAFAVADYVYVVFVACVVFVFGS